MLNVTIFHFRDHNTHKLIKSKITNYIIISLNTNQTDNIIHEYPLSI